MPVCRKGVHRPQQDWVRHKSMQVGRIGVPEVRVDRKAYSYGIMVRDYSEFLGFKRASTKPAQLGWPT